MHSILLKLTSVVLFSLCAVALADSAEPRVFTANAKLLNEVKAKLQAGDRQFDGPLASLRKDADAALKAKNYCVMDKPVAPASGDMHDYMTLAPYWWPDPNKPGGLPFIRHDGEVNPEREKFDHEPFEQMSKNVNTLALAYYFSDDEQYAQKAVEQIHVWFFDDATKMNPNLKFAQIVRGRESELKPSGVLEGDRLRRVIDADALLTGSKAWTPRDHDKFVAWMRQYYEWLNSADMAKLEAVQPNNHGTWYAAQTATFAMYLGDEAGARKWCEHGRELIASQIEPDGRQPHELLRTKAWDYSRYNILAHIQLASIGELVGVDLWTYQTPDGRSLRKAIEWMIPYSNGEKTWTYQQIEKPKLADMFMILRRAAYAYQDPRFEAEAQRVQQADPENSRFNLLFPKPDFGK